jgi:hypothetical protein
MAELIERQICFRLADTLAAAFPVGPFRLKMPRPRRFPSSSRSFLAVRNRQRTPLHTLEVSPLASARHG